MNVTAIIITGLLVVGALGAAGTLRAPAPPAKTETLTCVRVKQVTPAGTINYLCEVRK